MEEVRMMAWSWRALLMEFVEAHFWTRRAASEEGSHGGGIKGSVNLRFV